MKNFIRIAACIAYSLLLSMTALAQDASHHETATSRDSGDWGLLGLLGLVGLLGLRKKKHPDDVMRADATGKR